MNNTNKQIYSQIWDATDGLRAVEVTFMDDKDKIIDVKWGFIDSQNNVVIDFAYQCVWKFHNGLAKVKKNEKWGLIDNSGNVIIPIIYQSLHRLDCYAQVQSNGLCWGLLAEQGKELIPCEYDYLFAPIENLVYVKKNNKYGIVDLSNTLILDIVYDELSRDIKENRVKVRIGKEWSEIELPPHSLG